MNAEITERVLEEEKQKTLNQEIQKLEEEIFREGEEQKKEIERIDKVIQKMENDVKAKIESAIKLRRKVANVSSGVKIND
jgi:DNA-binding protein H-NS